MTFNGLYNLSNFVFWHVYDEVIQTNMSNSLMRDLTHRLQYIVNIMVHFRDKGYKTEWEGEIPDELKTTIIKYKIMEKK